MNEHEIAMEREEIRLMPDLEREELALLYQAKGIPEDQAQELAAGVMRDPERALAEKVIEELKIAAPSSSPLREAWITGGATAVGALIPVAVPDHHWGRRHLDQLRGLDAGSLRGGRGPKLLHRTERHPEWHGHVRGGSGCGRGGVLCGRVDHQTALSCTAKSQL